MIVSFSIAGDMISASIQDWSSNPVVISIDTTAAPNYELDFPAITACKEIPSHHESWEIPTLVFNSIDFLKCTTGNECNEKIFNETKIGFRDFVEELAANHLKADDYLEETNEESQDCIDEGSV